MPSKKHKIIDLITADLLGLDEPALAELYYLQQKLLNGSGLNNIRDISTDTLVKDFINAHQINSSSATIYNYRRLLDDFLANVQSNLNTNTISVYLRSKTWGDNTTRRNFIVIRRFLFFLFTSKYTELDLSACIIVPSRVNKRPPCPTSGQINDFIRSIGLVYQGSSDKLKFETIYKLYIKTGMRRNELLNLNVEDIDFDTGIIIVLKTKNKDVKIINMDDNLKDILTAYLDHFRHKSGPLFRGVQGKRLCIQSLNNSFQKIKARAGLPKDFKIHSFRRYFINELRKNKVDLSTIKELAGHRDIRTTEIYCNVSDEEKIKAIESIRV